MKYCRKCDIELPSHRSVFCSDECRKASYAKHTIKECVVCNKPFKVESSEKHCSNACRLATNRARTAKRRAQIRATREGIIDPKEVFKRYRWHCAMCNIYTPKALIGSFHNDSPTLDHIIPLAAGGTHTYNNLQLLCQYCNCSIKRNKVLKRQPCNPCVYHWMQAA